MATASYRAQAELRQVKRALEWAESTLELSDAEVGGALGASARSIARWREARNQPHDQHVQAAERLLEVANALEVVFAGDMERLHAWLHQSVPAFQGRTPLRTIADGKLDDVLTVLANIDTGAFV